MDFLNMSILFYSITLKAHRHEYRHTYMLKLLNIYLKM